MDYAPELILDSRADLGEGPAWDARTGLLSWVDIHAGQLHIFDPANGSDRSIALGEFLGCAAPRTSGGLALGLRHGFATLDPSTERLTRLVAPEAGLPGNRFNDGKCDPAGRFLAGSMDDAEVEATGALYSLAPDGTLKTLLSGTRISNGLTWSPDYRTFYFIDTPTRAIMAYDYDLTSGDIANPRPALSVPPELGWPDGMTSDSEGMLWVAMWGGAKLTRWDPATGRLLVMIPFPALNVSSCAFGGADLCDLYVTSARKGMTADQLAQYPLSGGLFRVQPDVEGIPTFPFAG
ncbi:MAG TPA: SMP-30/gluconolactonase/LRE family protein [Anaerolineales bacterium]|nr:SMP-30/gluconolactonase/LRE family protein [Anaerolineales bacterium]